MKLVPENIKESQNFERGQDPKKAMDLGLGDKLKAKEMYEKILSISKDPNYPKYMDGDIEGDPQDIQKLGDILGILYERGITTDFWQKYLEELHRAVDRWESRHENPTDVLGDVEYIAEELLNELDI